MSTNRVLRDHRGISGNIPYTVVSPETCILQSGLVRFSSHTPHQNPNFDARYGSADKVTDAGDGQVL